MKIILPKMVVDKSKINYPLFFITGPVRGGGGWQEHFCLELGKVIPEFFAAVPCRWRSGDRLFCYHVGEFSDAFESQTEWEHFYLEQAATFSEKRNGAIIFFLPLQNKEFPRVDGQPYARDTYGELGAWRRTLVFRPSIKLLVGADSDFPGLKVIRRNFKHDLGYDFPIHESMEELAKAAAAWVNEES